MTAARRRDLWRRLRSAAFNGSFTGCLLATVYSAFVIAVTLLNGSTVVDKHGVSLTTVVVTYYVAGTLGGAIVGALNSFARSGVSPVLLGIPAGLISFFCIGTATEGPFWTWDRSVWEGVAIMGVILGAAAGAVWRRFGVR